MLLLQITLSIILLISLFYIIDSSITIHYLNKNTSNNGKEKTEVKNWNIIMLTVSCLLFTAILSYLVLSFVYKKPLMIEKLVDISSIKSE